MNISEIRPSIINTESVTTNNIDVLVGSIYYFVTMNQPTGWLICNGQAVNRTTYKDLFDAIGTTYGAGNSSSTFNLPDFRGTFLRCATNGNNSYDPDSAVNRSLGSYQDYATREMYGHTYSFQCDYWRTGERAYGVFRDSQYSGSTDSGGSDDWCSKMYLDTNRGSLGSEYEVRPKNVTLTPCIKY